MSVMALIGCEDTVEVARPSSLELDQATAEPRRLELGEAEVVEVAEPPDLIVRDRRTVHTSVEGPSPLIVQVAPMDMMTATRSRAVSLFVSDGDAAWSSRHIADWRARLRAVDLGSGRDLNTTVTYLPADYSHSQPFHRLDLSAGEVLAGGWYAVAVDLTGLNAVVSGATPVGGDVYVARFRPDSHPMLTHLTALDTPDGLRLSARFTEQIVFDNGVQDVHVLSDAGEVHCEPVGEGLRRATAVLELRCPGLTADAVFSVVFDSTVATVEHVPLFGADDRAPAAGRWEPRSLQRLEDVMVLPLIPATFLVDQF